MTRRVLGQLCLVLLLVEAAAPLVARAGCTSPAEVAALGVSLDQNLRCARRELEQGSATSCASAAAPACAGSGVADVVDLVTGAGPAPAPAGSAARLQLRCQRAILGASKRFVGRRVRELASGLRQSRLASVFAPVRKACNGITVTTVQATQLPTLGGPCAPAVAPATGPLDGTRVARCTRGALDRLSGIMTSGVPRPNIVLVLTDDENVGGVPWMARVGDLQQRGVNFVNSFAPTPVCGPSRAGILSALYAHHHGVIYNYEAAPTFDSSSTLATWLHDAGYATAMIGKYMNYAADLTAVPPGWDQWQVLIGEETGDGNGYSQYGLDENGVDVQHGPAPGDYSTDLFARRGLDFMREHASEPFFLLFAPFAPHLPAIPAQRHAGSLAYIASWRPDNWREEDLSLKPTWVNFMRSITPADSAATYDAQRVSELESLLAVDEAVGKIEDSLESLGLTDDTLLVFTSDNGYHWGEHWWNSKFTQYEESVRVPLVVSYPALAPEPATRDELVANIDLAPTMAELAAAVVPGAVDGRSLVPLLTGPGAVHDDLLLQDWAAVIVPAWEGVRGPRFKYVHTDAQGGVMEELYDTIADPEELANLAFDPAYASTLDALRQRLSELQSQ